MNQFNLDIIDDSKQRLITQSDSEILHLAKSNDLKKSVLVAGMSNAESSVMDDKYLNSVHFAKGF